MAWTNGKIENSHDFLLFEASGDSEVAVDSNNIGDHTKLANSNNILGDTEGYDAESCSCSEYPSNDHHHLLDFDHEFNDDDDDDDKDHLSDMSSTHQQEPRLTDRMMAPFAAAVMEGQEEEEEVESRFCVNGSTVDILIRDDIDEMERNRLFWKTCLQFKRPLWQVILTGRKDGRDSLSSEATRGMLAISTTLLNHQFQSHGLNCQARAHTIGVTNYTVRFVDKKKIVQLHRTIELAMHILL